MRGRETNTGPAPPPFYVFVGLTLAKAIITGQVDSEYFSYIFAVIMWNGID